MINGTQNGGPPQVWNERAAHATGTVLDFNRAAVQFVGREKLALHDTVMTVPLFAIFELVGQLLLMANPAHSGNPALRQAMNHDPRQLPLL